MADDDQDWQRKWQQERSGGREPQRQEPQRQEPQRQERGHVAAESGAPTGPTELKKQSWMDVLKRTVREFKEDELTDRAAALTYYGVLAIFPAILALVSVLGLVGASATQPLIDNLGKVAPGEARNIFTTAVANLEKSQATGVSCSSSAWPAPCGRHRDTWPHSSAPRTRSTTSRRDGRS